MKLLFTLLINAFVIGLFLYSKLLPYKDKLNPRYAGIFRFFASVFTPVLNFFKSFIKPFQVGQGLAVDMSQIVLLILLLIITNLL